VLENNVKMHAMHFIPARSGGHEDLMIAEILGVSGFGGFTLLLRHNFG